MKKLLLMRHAKSSWKNLQRADHDRKLNKRGKRDASRMGAWLQQHDHIPDLIISSTARRAERTARRVRRELDPQPELVTDPDLYHGLPADYATAIRQVAPNVDTLLVIGHNPGLEEFLSRITGADELLPTASIALVTLSDPWPHLPLHHCGELLHVCRPRELPAIETES